MVPIHTANPPPPTAAAHPCLPPDDAARVALHNEVHARPTARIRLPALIIDIAVLHEGVAIEAECAHPIPWSGSQ